MDFYDIPSKFKVQHKVNNLLRPSVGVLASPLAERSLLLNDLSYVELFRQFSTIPYAGNCNKFIHYYLEIVNSVSKTSKKTQVLQLDNFNMNFVDLNIYSKIDSSLRDALLEKMLESSLTQDDVTKKQFLLGEIYDDYFFQRDFSYCSWFENLVAVNNQFIDNSTSHNYINSIVGVIFVVSSEELDVIQSVKSMEERVEKLISDPQHHVNNLFHWSSKVVHRYYLVVRTNSNVSTNSNVLDYMQTHFNGEGHFIELNSGNREESYLKFADSYHKNICIKEAMADKKKIIDSSPIRKITSQLTFVDPLNANGEIDHPLSSPPSKPNLMVENTGNDAPTISTLNRIHRQLYYTPSENTLRDIREMKPAFYLSNSDLEKVSNFMLVYVTSSLVPFLLDLKIQVQQAVNLKMRGTKYLLNSAKEFFRYGKNYTKLSTSFLSSSSLTSLQSWSYSNSNQEKISTGDIKKNLQTSYDTIFSNFATVNALKKFQADITYILQDYSEAHSLYTQLYKEINGNDTNEQSVKIASLEMRLITSFFIDNSKNINLANCETIHTRYANSPYHLRFCYIMSTVFLSLNRCLDSCNVLATLTQQVQEYSYLPIILEQIGSLMYRFIRMNNLFGIGRMHLRKFAHYMLMAGQDYYKNEKFVHGHLCYQKAFNCYNQLNWPYLKCHVDRSYIKSLFHLKCYERILDMLQNHDFYNTSVDAQNQLLNLQFIFNLYQYFNEHFSTLLKFSTSHIYQCNKWLLKFSPIRLSVNSIVHLNKDNGTGDGGSVNPEQCTLCNLNPRLKPNDHSSLYRHQNIALTQLCRNCEKGVFNESADETLLDVARKHLHISHSDQCYTISPSSCCYKDCPLSTNSHHYNNVINNKYRIYLSLSHSFSVPIIISNIRVNWTFLPKSGGDIVVSQENCDNYKLLIDLGEDNFGGTFCLSGVESAQVYFDLIPRVEGEFSISSVSYQIYSINCSSTVFLDRQRSENTLNEAASPENFFSDRFENSPNYSTFFSSPNNYLNLLHGADGAQYKAVSVPTFFNSSRASIPENNDIFGVDRPNDNALQSFKHLIIAPNSNVISNDSHQGTFGCSQIPVLHQLNRVVNFEYKVKVESVSMCNNQVLMNFHDLKTPLPSATIRDWKIKMFFKEGCKAVVRFVLPQQQHHSNDLSWHCFVRVDSSCVDFDDSYPEIAESCGFYGDDHRSRCLVLSKADSTADAVEIPLRMVYHSNLFVDSPSSAKFFHNIHETQFFVLFARKDINGSVAYFKSCTIPLFNIFLESLTATIHIHELDSCSYVGESLDFSAFRLRVECISKLANTATSVHSVVFNDLMLYSDNVQMEHVTLDTMPLQSEGQTVNHLAECYPRVLECAQANKNIFSARQNPNPYFADMFKRLLADKSLFYYPCELKMLLTYQINLTKKSDDEENKTLENFTVDGHFVVGIDAPSELKNGWFLENMPRSSKIVLSDKTVAPFSLGFNVIMDSYQLKHNFNSNAPQNKLSPYHGEATLLLWNKLNLPLRVYIETHPNDTQSHFMWCGKTKFNVTLPPTLNDGQVTIKRFPLNFIVLKPGFYDIGKFVMALTATEKVEPCTLPITYALKRPIPIAVLEQ